METKDGLANPGIKQGDTGVKRGKGTKRKADEAMTQAKSKKSKNTKKVDSLFTLASKALTDDLAGKLSTKNADSLLKSINNSTPSDILVEAYSTLIKRLLDQQHELETDLWCANSAKSALKYENDKLREDIDQLLNDRYDIDQLLG
jgi:hypothetical protein